jgi:hypothetical protein
VNRAQEKSEQLSNTPVRIVKVPRGEERKGEIICKTVAKNISNLIKCMEISI